MSSLRICYKPNSGSRILDLVGRKSTKELLPGELCLLFIKLQVPRIRPSRSEQDAEDIDQASLFAEIQSIVGTLEQDILHVEARYKHSLVHEANTVTCRTVCKIRRPKADSRWSICSSRNEQHSSCSNAVHERLANYISAHCPPQQALDLIHYHLGLTASDEPPVNLICTALENQIRAQSSRSLDDKPSILISDTSLEADSSVASPAASEQFSTGPCSSLSDTASRSQHSTRSLVSLLPTATPGKVPKLHTVPVNSGFPSTTVLPTNTESSNAENKAPIPNQALPQPKSPTARTPTPAPNPDISPPSQEDSARTVWKHIRQSSLTHLQHLLDSAPETLERLEAEDEGLRELRKQALANKRSVGAETLRAWRWDEKMGQGGVAPWM